MEYALIQLPHILVSSQISCGACGPFPLQLWLKSTVVIARDMPQEADSATQWIARAAKTISFSLALIRLHCLLDLAGPAI